MSEPDVVPIKGTYQTMQEGNGDPVTIEPADGLNFTLKEMQTGMARVRRNRLLADSDVMVLSDRGLSASKVTEWKTYRKSLRDLDFSDVESNHIEDITWPTKPA